MSKMVEVRDIANIVPGVMAVGLVAENVRALKAKKSKDMGLKRMVKLGMGNIVGATMIGATASEVNKL
jgi:hypothetical protein